MSVLFYTPMVEGVGKRLQRAIELVAPVEKIRICHTIGSLYQELCQPKDESSIAVLLAATQKDLLDILSLRDLLSDLRLILILPDTEDDTIAKGHVLCPRFVSSVDSDFSAVSAVLKKMLRRFQ
jgi:hypothetical protein